MQTGEILMNNFFWWVIGMQSTLLALKVIKAISWPWLAVLFPSWGLSASAIAALLLMIGGFFIYDFVQRIRK